LSFTMWLAAAGSGVVFLVALLLRETVSGRRAVVVGESSHEGMRLAQETASEDQMGS